MPAESTDCCSELDMHTKEGNLTQKKKKELPAEPTDFELCG